MLVNDDWDEEMEGFERYPEAFLEQVRHGLILRHPQLRNIFIDLMNNDNNYANEAYNNIAHEDGEETDSTYTPSIDESIGHHSADDFQLIIQDARDLVLHDPIQLVDNQRYPGPFDDPVISGECDCHLFNGNLIGACLTDNLQNNWLGIDFEEELAAARIFHESNQLREANNLQRKRMYRDIWQHLGNNIELEHDEETGRYARLRLPNCSYALVRMIWPSLTGRYMGFRIH